MSNQLYVSIVLITLATTGRCDYDFSSEDNKITAITPDSISSVCNQVNTYTSYQECTCDQFCLINKNSECCSDQQYCKERQYKYEELSCQRTLSGDVYMVNTCLPNYSRKKIISKCQTTNLTEILNDFFITLPITSPQNITYRNIYCGLCNNVPAYVIWNLAVRCENINSTTSKADNINSTSLFYNLDINPDGTYLYSTVGDSMFKCTTYGYPPYGWTDSVRYCGSSNETRKCSLCEKSSSDNRCVDATLLFSSSLKNGYLLRDINEYMYRFIYEDKSAFSKVFYNIATDLEKCSPKGKIPICKYESEAAGHFYYVDNETIFVKGDINASYSHKNWNRTLNRDGIYFCLDVDPTPTLQGNFLIKFKWWLALLSTLFLSLYLFTRVVNRNTNLRSLPFKIVFSFSIALYGIYIFDQLRPFNMSCTITAISSHYFYLSFHIWLAIAAYEYWRVICYLSPRCENMNKVPHKKRFIVYSLIAWVPPLFVVAIGLYFDSVPISIIPCKIKPAYGVDDACFVRSQDEALLYLYSLPSSASFIVVIICFVFTNYYLYSARCKNDTSCLQNDYKKLLFKLAIGMGLPWTIDFGWMYTYNQLVQQASFFINALQGTFIFFAFGYERSMFQCTCAKRELVEMTTLTVGTTTISRHERNN